MTGYDFKERVFSQARLKREISDALGESASESRITFLLAKELYMNGYLTVPKRKGNEDELPDDKADTEAVANNLRRYFREENRPIECVIPAQYLCAV